MVETQVSRQNVSQKSITELTDTIAGKPFVALSLPPRRLPFTLPAGTDSGRDQAWVTSGTNLRRWSGMPASENGWPEPARRRRLRPLPAASAAWPIPTRRYGQRQRGTIGTGSRDSGAGSASLTNTGIGCFRTSSECRRGHDFVRPSKNWKPFVRGHYGVTWRWVPRRNKKPRHL